jgi:hypothetical protein
MVKEASSSIQGSKDDISYRAAEPGMRLRQSYLVHPFIHLSPSLNWGIYEE